MKTQFRVRNPPWQLVIGPPIASAVVFSIAGAMIGENVFPGHGLGLAGGAMLVGFMFGSGVWSEMLITPWKKMTLATDTVNAITPQVKSMRIELNLRQGTDAYPAMTMDLLDLPPTMDFVRLAQMAQIVVDNRMQFTGSLLYPRKVGNPLSRSEYEAIRRIFIKYEILEWINPNDPHPGVRVCVPMGTRFFNRLEIEAEKEKDLHSPTGLWVLRSLLK